MKKPILEIKNLTASYGSLKALDKVNLTVYENDYLGVIGPNGGGKTTLIKCVLGLKEYESGEIIYYIDGKPQPNITIGYLPQYTVIDKKFPISVLEVILSGLSCQKNLLYKYSASDKEKALHIIHKMGLIGLEKRPIGELSGGQLQRAILGRSLISEPKILILDEPSTYIDKKFEAELYQLLKEIQKDCAIVLVSHDIVTTLRQANCIAAINKQLSYSPTTEIEASWLEEKFECPIELLGFGHL